MEEPPTLDYREAATPEPRQSWGWFFAGLGAGLAVLVAARIIFSVLERFALSVPMMFGRLFLLIPVAEIATGVVLVNKPGWKRFGQGLLVWVLLFFVGAVFAVFAILRSL